MGPFCLDGDRQRYDDDREHDDSVRPAQRVAILEARVESDSLWNVGLVKLVLVQEFKSWQHWGRTQQQADKTMTDWKRDKASAEMAFDHFVASMPQQIRDEVAGQQRSLVEMLMEYAGHDPTKGN